MSKARVFISFDFDHDEDLRNLLVGQAKNPDSPFELADWSVKERIDDNWRDKVRSRIRKCEQVIVICGEYTDTATGVSEELRITQEEEKPYFLLQGRRDKICRKPKAAKNDDDIYSWTWDNLKNLIKGCR